MSDALDWGQFGALTYGELRRLQQWQVSPCRCERMAHPSLPTMVIKISYSPITLVTRMNEYPLTPHFHREKGNFDFFYGWIGTIDLTVDNQSWLLLSVTSGGTFFRTRKEKPVVVAGIEESTFSVTVDGNDRTVLPQPEGRTSRYECWRINTRLPLTVTGAPFFYARKEEPASCCQPIEINIFSYHWQ